MYIKGFLKLESYKSLKVHLLLLTLNMVLFIYQSVLIPL